MSWFNQSLVKILRGSDFSDTSPWELRKERRCSFVLFYADWCGHCQNLKPEYIKFADYAQFIHIYAVDVDAERNLLERINNSESSPVKIKSYPTILVYRDGKPWRKYNDQRTWQALLSEATRVCNTECDCANQRASN